MINLQWGGHANGNIDTALLVNIGGGHYLEPTAAKNWSAMREACHAATGMWIEPAPNYNAVESCYRDLANQGHANDVTAHGGPTSAVKGTSNHGWGRAIDIAGYDQPGVWAWLLAHAAWFGFYWATGQASGEKWHWESLAAPSTITVAAAKPIPQPLENIMWLIMSKNRGQYLVGPGYKHHLSPGESAQVMGPYQAKQLVIDFGDNDREFDLFVSAHTNPTT